MAPTKGPSSFNNDNPAGDMFEYICTGDNGAQPEGNQLMEAIPENANG